MVFRVSRSLILGLSNAVTNWFVMVAIPVRRPMKFRRTRSALRISLMGPFSVARVSVALNGVLLGWRLLISVSEFRQAKTVRMIFSPKKIPGSLAMMWAVAGRFSEMQSSEVMSAAGQSSFRAAWIRGFSVCMLRAYLLALAFSSLF